MTSLCRLVVAALGTGALGVFICLPLLDAAPQQKAKVAAPPAPQDAPKKPADTAKKDGEFTDALTLPTKREAKQRIEATDSYIQGEDWPVACQLLQSLLEEPEDVFVQVKRADPTGQDSLVWTSARAEANRLIGKFPQAALETYEVLYGARAKERMTAAKTKGDVDLLAEVALKYFHTEAGAEATNLLGTYHLDRGRPMIAALCFEKLVQRLPPAKVPPLMLFKAYLAQRQLGDDTAANQLWKQLSARAGRDGLRLGEQTVSLDQLRKEIDQMPAGGAPDSQSVTMFRVNAARSGHAQGSVPYLKRRWEVSMLPLDGMRGLVDTKRWVGEALSEAEKRGNVLPGYFPIAANNRLVFRTYWGLFAVNLKTGEREWWTEMNRSLEAVMANPSYRHPVQGWLESYRPGSLHQHVLLENSTVGTLSTDLNRVYAVDDLAVPPHTNNQAQQMGIGNPQFPVSGGLADLINQNLLRAYDLDNGLLKWEVGSDRGPKELQNCHFLGAPLPLSGKLYVLAEQNAELRLLCLEPSRKDHTPPSVLWAQTLATMQVKLAQDPGRRIQAANLAYGDGVLVCPTNAGAVLGVDLLSHSLVWAYPYREGDNYTKMRGHRNFQGAMRGALPILPVKSPEWKASAPVIQDGRIIFTAPDAASVHCLRLRDGARLWKIPRGDDLYLAGIFKDKVLLVGKTYCRALNAATGEQVWTKEIGQPSGQGVGHGSCYYLPVKKPVPEIGREPGVCKIDLENGKVLSYSRCRDDEALGNLIFYEGEVVSQNEQWVRAYPQLEAEIARLDRELTANPTNANRLAERGELRLDHGDLKGAIEDLSMALKNNPPESLVPKTRDKLYDTLTELLQRDFASAEPYLAQYEHLCTVTVPADADPKTRREAQDKERVRRATYWCLLAKGREEQGRHEESFKAYLEYGGLAGPGELLPVVGQPGVKARPDVWAQGRIVGLLEKAGPAARKNLEGDIAGRWETVRQSGDTATVRGFVNTFGSLSAAVGREGRLHLAERLLAEAERLLKERERPLTEAERLVKEGACLEAEMQLLQLRDQTADPVMAARAVEALARLMLLRVTAERGLLQDAAFYYAQLGREYAKVTLPDGRTGLDHFNEAAANPLLLPRLDEPVASFPAGRMKAKEVLGVFGNAQNQMVYTLEARGETLPFHDRLRLGFNTQNYRQLRVMDRDSNEERWGQTLDMTNASYLFAQNPSVRPTYYLSGHMAVVFLGHMVYGLDLVERKEIWKRSLLGNEPLGNQWQIYLDQDGLYSGVPSGGAFERLGAIGPVTSAYVILLTREGLVALEPATGSVLWTKADVPARTVVFGDDESVFLVDAREGGGGTARVVRGKDGSAVDAPDFAALFGGKTRPRAFGRRLLVTEPGDKEQVVLRLYDIPTGKDLWRKTVAANSLPVRSEVPELAGVLEPSGAVTLVNLKTGQPVLHPEMFRPEHAAVFAGTPSSGFPWAGLQLNSTGAKAATIQADHMEKGMKTGIQDVLLLQDADRYYVILNTTAVANVNVNAPARVQGPWANVQGLRHLPVSGYVYAFNRTRGIRDWFIDNLPPQILILDRFEELPVLLFTARVQKQLAQGANTQTFSTLSYDKRTGKRVYERDSYSNSTFYALKIDRRAGQVDLISHNLTLRHYVAGTEGDAAGQPTGSAPARSDVAPRQIVR